MGFMDKIVSKLTPTPPDYAAEMNQVLPAGDAYLAHCLVVPSAFERGGSGGSGANRLLGKAVDAASTAVSGARHVGGGEGSIAHGLSRAADLRVFVIGTSSVSWWDFGYNGSQLPPEHGHIIARSDVVSFVDTGQTAQGGVPVARITFADDSFFDYRLMDKPDTDFWNVAAQL
ncbi:hypothetical protein [Aeromicrobium endophyticum]|uniref:Uncharacterized protein n=1 Tax=Aeromicrobium endophyticum TaxID=2292704 RepID=A0A371P1G7_9ACTN|nr:hypothetical protein [Aeromicrobium endophyticum]REK69755.1 hypothetical protein DX116_11160 [Aeromicrobium endophyticum]